MALENAENAIIDPAKIREYLLSPTHPVGRFKARFFGTLGYTVDHAEALEIDIRSLINSEEAILREGTNFGEKYEVRGNIIVPNGRTVELVTVWIVLTGEAVPRFVTAYPGGE